MDEARKHITDDDEGGDSSRRSCVKDKRISTHVVGQPQIPVDPHVLGNASPEA